MNPPLFAVIIAGGRGTRFWPLSRRHRPKQVLALTGEHSLIRQTVDRLAPLVPAERVLVVTGPDMEAAVRAELPMLAPDQVLIEPSGRNTAPCVGWAAVEVARRAGPDALLAILPADHVIARPQVLREALAGAAAAAASRPCIVTLGIQPERPETGFGYLELGAEAGRFAGQDLRVVDRFREKPDAATAAAWLAGGRHLWNAGMFVFQARTMRTAFTAHLPRSAAALDAIAADPAALDAQWPELEATSIDYGIMERHDDILTVPCDPGWSDVGAWPAAAEVLPPVEGGRGRVGRSIAIDSDDNVVFVPDRLVALVGVSDLVVVDAGDALLVMDKGRAQQLKDVLAALEARDLDEYT
ncbi:MAG: NTP transferase domain-containing protein [Alphaproteobacteria bacterium]|nr:NTP transferase domain-containing protein [Alphaproteobacteria bacterium]